jgi:phosphohistidine phosphatase
MSIYLVQHGKNRPKDVDPDKGLSDEGRNEVERIATVAEGYGVPVTGIVHSGKTRARQTAEIFDQALAPADGTSAADGMGPLDDVEAFAEGLDPASSRMYVGHLPFMEKLAAYLVTGTSDRPVFKFQNGGIVGLDREPEADTWVIRWALMPKIS